MTDPKPVKSNKTRNDANVGRWVAAGVATGIGSAALVAALLYTKRNKPNTPVAPVVTPEDAPETD